MSNKAIIEKLKELVRCVKEFANATSEHDFKRAKELNEKGNQLESEIASLEAQDKEPELTKDILKDILMAYVNYTDFDVKDVINDEWLVDKFLNSIMPNLIAPKG